MNLFVNYYQPQNARRRGEIDECLRRNIASRLFRVYVLKEPSVQLPDFARGVLCRDWAPRPTFADTFTWANTVTTDGDINIIANADIYFDETIALVKEMRADEFYVLTRYGVSPSAAPAFYGKEDSQDAWIFRGRPRDELFTCAFAMGVPRCDSRLAFEARCAGYHVSNPSLTIKAYHLHGNPARDYRIAPIQTGRVHGDILFVPPRTLEETRCTRPRPTPFISVIIPVYNDSVRLQLCLAALAKQTYPRDRFEVIVIDNGSTEDITRTVEQFSFARIVREPVPGSYAARNKGIAMARGEILAFTDADCIPSRPWLENGCRTLQSDPECGFVGGRVEMFFRNPNRPTAVEMFDSLNAFSQKAYIEKSHFGVTANILAFRKVFASVGPFDQTLKSQADVTWGQAAWRAGYKAVFSGDAIVRHPARYTLKEMARKHRRMTGGFFQRYKGRGRFPNHMRVFLADCLVKGLSRHFWFGGVYRDIAFGVKARVLLVSLYIAHIRLCELVRLAFGGEPQR